MERQRTYWNYDRDVRRSVIGNNLILVACLILTVWHICLHNWLYAATTACWAAGAITSRNSALASQRTRDDQREWRQREATTNSN